MWRFAGVLAIALTAPSCTIEVVPVRANGSLQCTYDGVRTVSGEVAITGEALNVINFNGAWTLCAVVNPPAKGTFCTLNVATSTGSL